jgi:hypothetical protein
VDDRFAAQQPIAAFNGAFSPNAFARGEGVGASARLLCVPGIDGCARGPAALVFTRASRECRRA